MFNLAIDSKLRSCDLVNLRVRDFAVGGAWQSDHGPGDGAAKKDATVSSVEPHTACVPGETDDVGIG
jgi:hypothetical protein